MDKILSGKIMPGSPTDDRGASEASGMAEDLQRLATGKFPLSSKYTHSCAHVSNIVGKKQKD